MCFFFCMSRVSCYFNCRRRRQSSFSLVAATNPPVYNSLVSIMCKLCSFCCWLCNFFLLLILLLFIYCYCSLCSWFYLSVPPPPPLSLSISYLFKLDFCSKILNPTSNFALAFLIFSIRLLRSRSRFWEKKIEDLSMHKIKCQEMSRDLPTLYYVVLKVFGFVS